MVKLKKIWHEKPLVLIFWIAFLMRLFASLFSQGYMGNSFNENLEIAFFWFKGFDKYNLFPWNQDIPIESDKNFFEIFFYYLIFFIIDIFKITDTKVILLIIKIIYSFISLLTVYYSYTFTKNISNQKIATYVSLLIAVFWLIPFLSTQTFSVELGLPFILAGFYYISKFEKTLQSVNYLSAGFFFGVAVSFNFAFVFLIIFFLLIFIFRSKFIHLIHILFGFIISFFILSGIIDFIFWGKPFIQFFNYFEFTINNLHLDLTQFAIISAIYFVSSFGIYFIFVFFGIIYSVKKFYLYVISTFLFVIFQCVLIKDNLFNGLVFISEFLIFGIPGWFRFIEEKNLSVDKSKISKWIYFSGITINVIVFFFFSTVYYNKAKTEVTYYIGNNITEDGNILIISDKTVNMTDFFFGKKINKYIYYTNYTNENLKYSSEQINKNTRNIFSLNYFDKYSIKIDYILIFGNKNSSSFSETLRKYFPPVFLEKQFKSSSFDITSFIGVDNESIYLYVNE